MIPNLCSYILQTAKFWVAKLLTCILRIWKYFMAKVNKWECYNIVEFSSDSDEMIHSFATMHFFTKNMYR